MQWTGRDPSRNRCNQMVESKDQPFCGYCEDRHPQLAEASDIVVTQEF